MFRDKFELNKLMPKSTYTRDVPPPNRYVLRAICTFVSHAYYAINNWAEIAKQQQLWHTHTHTQYAMTVVDGGNLAPFRLSVYDVDTKRICMNEHFAKHSLRSVALLSPLPLLLLSSFSSSTGDYMSTELHQFNVWPVVRLLQIISDGNATF